MRTSFFFILVLVLSACEKEKLPTHLVATPTADLLARTEPAARTQEIATPPVDVKLPVSFERHIGDLDDMVKRRTIRALVVVNPIGFF